MSPQQPARDAPPSEPAERDPDNKMRPPSPDRLPGRRDGLPPGSLGGVPVDPQGDENRDPPRNAPTPPP